MSDFDWEPSDKTLERIRNSGKWGEYRREVSWRDKAARVVAAFGVVVIWSPIPHRIGEIIPQGKVSTSYCAENVADQPFMVVLATAAKSLRILQRYHVGQRGDRSHPLHLAQQCRVPVFFPAQLFNLLVIPRNAIIRCVLFFHWAGHGTHQDPQCNSYRLR